MSVLIKGMELPENERYVDVRIFADGRATTATGERPFYREMEVIELPSPHGRLIDADALQDKGWFLTRDNIYKGQIEAAILTRAPTILEAEGGESDERTTRRS